jgi:tRNA (cmo5U34)-methyltransferase
METNVASTASFNRDAAGYDAMRRRLIPCFDDFYGTALTLIGDWKPQKALRVLDVGAGTGLF